MITRLPSVTPILPWGSRLVAYDPGSKNGVLAVEVPATIVTLKMHFDTGQNGATTEDYARRDRQSNRAIFKIAMPHLVFANEFTYDETAATGAQRIGQAARFAIGRVRLYWRPAPLRDHTDGLWSASIPNLYGDGGICWGNTTADTTTFAARIEDQIKNFFTNGFTNHLGMKKPDDVNSYVDWEMETAADPVCWLNWPLWSTPAPRTFASLATGITTEPLVAPTLTMNLPEPPRVFGIGRAREWIGTLDERAQRVVLEAMRDALTEAPDAANA